MDTMLLRNDCIVHGLRHASYSYTLCIQADARESDDDQEAIADWAILQTDEKARIESATMQQTTPRIDALRAARLCVFSVRQRRGQLLLLPPCCYHVRQASGGRVRLMQWLRVSACCAANALLLDKTPALPGVHRTAPTWRRLQLQPPVQLGVYHTLLARSRSRARRGSGRARRGTGRFRDVHHLPRRQDTVSYAEQHASRSACDAMPSPPKPHLTLPRATT